MAINLSPSESTYQPVTDSEASVSIMLTTIDRLGDTAEGIDRLESETGDGELTQRVFIKRFDLKETEKLAACQELLVNIKKTAEKRIQNAFRTLEEIPEAHPLLISDRPVPNPDLILRSIRTLLKYKIRTEANKALEKGFDFFQKWRSLFSDAELHDPTFGYRVGGGYPEHYYTALGQYLKITSGMDGQTVPPNLHQMSADYFEHRLNSPGYPKNTNDLRSLAQILERSGVLSFEGDESIFDRLTSDPS